ncbi:MAG: hypothetical protein ACI843_002179 [Psychrobacter glaciei]|jgi:hypothetical protein
MPTALMIAAAKTEDQKGQLSDILLLEQQLNELAIETVQLVIEPLSADWFAAERPGFFRSGCGPIEALAEAKRLIESGAQAVVISGYDHLKTGYQREIRLQKMLVYGEDYPLTQAYTDLAKAFCRHHNINQEQFKSLSSALFANYKASYQQSLGDNFETSLLPAARWYEFITDLFRGVDCANPLIDFSGRVLITNSETADKLSVGKGLRLEIKAVGLSRLSGDGPNYIDEISTYQHLEKAYKQACSESGIDFARRFYQGDALMEVYTCYPVVPMAFLMASGLVDSLSEITDFLQRHKITVTGGMNLARGAWNNPALNGLISVYQRLCISLEAQPSVAPHNKATLGLVHGNGGLGYRQGVAILQALRS